MYADLAQKSPITALQYHDMFEDVITEFHRQADAHPGYINDDELAFFLEGPPATARQ
jgi:hypothetical protein